MEPLTIVVAAITVVVSFSVGYIVGNYIPLVERKGGEIDTEEVELQAAKVPIQHKDGSPATESEMPSEEVVGTEVASGPEPAPDLPLDMRHTIQLWHDRKAQKILAEIDENLVDLDDTLTSEQHSRLSLALVDLQARVGLAVSMKAAEAEKNGDISVDDSTEESTKEGFNPLKTLVNIIQSDVPKLVEESESIPSQINAILQDMMEGTSLAERGIQVTDWPERGVIFLVGIDTYETIDDIPDLEIQAVIRKAVAEWERRSEEKA